ncbi:MAG: hypothetical protein K0S29_73 [Gammaproteobacteria bacterium]|jgi:hypothetical protein|nr:hypothetical protein [Gammaproteobacteria bacterium]
MHKGKDLDTTQGGGQLLFETSMQAKEYRRRKQQSSFSFARFFCCFSDKKPSPKKNIKTSSGKSEVLLKNDI